MKKLVFYLIVFGFVMSCTSKKNNGHWIYPPLSLASNDQDELFQDKCLHITANNLSEDMSALSTKNDEVFVFIYDYSDTNELKAPVVSKKVIFDKDNLSLSIGIPKKDNLILFFIEEDSFRESIEIEPIVRVYFKELLKAGSYNEIEKYLGEDDLLGVKFIDSKTSTFTISGRSSLNKYEYSFEIK